MDTVTATFQIPAYIAEGLTNGAYERVGGVVREVGNKQVVSWLREATSNISNTSSLLPNGSTPSILSLGSTASILNLGLSVMGFAVVMHRLNELEQRLKQSEALLNKINRKIDLGFYANFRAALDLATNAFLMDQTEARKNMAIQAINRFLEAEHIYTDFVNREIEVGSQIAGEYLLTLYLAYIVEARCYLEIEEPNTALRCFQEGADKLRSQVKKYVELLLTSNPAVYLHPRFKDQIDLSRLTRIYKALDPSLTKNAVFQLQRENLFNLGLCKDANLESEYGKWVESLPAAIVSSIEVPGSIWGNKTEMGVEAFKRLPKAMETMESIIETNDRFIAYQEEVKTISKLKISFHDWLQLTPTDETLSEETRLMYIIPSNSKFGTILRHFKNRAKHQEL